MTFSLLHFIASHPRNADMLKRALRDDTDARRLFSYLGVTPTHLADIDEGAIARRSAALSVPRTVDVTAPDSCAVRLAEAETTIKALEARLAEQTPPEPPKAYERDGMKPEHRIARIRRLFCFSDEWLESNLERLHEDYRAMYRALDREKGSGGEAAIKALRDRAESAEASVQELRQRLQAEIMAHSATQLRADHAESASEHGPLTDLLVITERKVEAFYLPKAPEESRCGVSVEGYLHTHGATTREALIRMRDQVRERLAQTAAPAQTPPEEVIVLGPWRNENGVMRREKLAGPWEGFAFMHAYPTTPKGAWSCILPEQAHEADQTHEDIGGMPVADDWAREHGYALIDAEPGSLSGTLSAWHASYGRYHEAKWSGGFILIDDNREGLWACPGWRIITTTPTHPKGTAIAEGPQTGEEGKRYALAAAHALGLTGGGE